MLTRIINNNFTRYITLAAALATSSVAYAQETEPVKDGSVPTPKAYYLKGKRTREQRQAALDQNPPPNPSSSAPSSQSYQSSARPAYVAPVSVQEKSSKGWAWAAFIGGGVVTVAGFAAGPMELCGDYASSLECKQDRSIQYVLIGSGALLAGAGLVGLLSK